MSITTALWLFVFKSTMTVMDDVEINRYCLFNIIIVSALYFSK